jgi:hypothetical protein
MFAAFALGGLLGPVVAVPMGGYRHLPIFQVGLAFVVGPLVGLFGVAMAVGMWRNMMRRTTYDDSGISGLLVIDPARSRMPGVRPRGDFLAAPISWADVDHTESERVRVRDGPDRYLVVVHLRDGRRAHTYPNPVARSAAADRIVSQLESARTAASDGDGR